MVHGKQHSANQNNVSSESGLTTNSIALNNKI